MTKPGSRRRKLLRPAVIAAFGGVLCAVFLVLAGITSATRAPDDASASSAPAPSSSPSSVHE